MNKAEVKFARRKLSPKENYSIKENRLWIVDNPNEARILFEGNLLFKKEDVWGRSWKKTKSL